MGLPNETLVTIFEQLNVKDLKSITLTDPRFYDIVINTPSINRKFKLNVKWNYDDNIIEALMESDRYFENIFLPIPNHESEHCQSSKTFDLIKNLMKKIGDRVKNAEFQNQSGKLCPKSIFEVLETILNIEALQFRSLSISSKCSVKSTIPIKFNQLKKVDFPVDMLLPILKHVTTIKELSINSIHEFRPKTASDISLEVIEFLSNNQSTLQSLEIKSMIQIFKQDVQVLFKIYTSYRMIWSA